MENGLLSSACLHSEMSKITTVKPERVGATGTKCQNAEQNNNKQLKRCFGHYSLLHEH